MELLITGPEGTPTKVQLRKNPLSLGRSADNDLPIRTIRGSHVITFLSRGRNRGGGLETAKAATELS